VYNSSEQHHLEASDDKRTWHIGQWFHRSCERDCIAALQRVASYHLPDAVDRRLVWLSENKEKLSQAQREELEALVEFTEERTIEKLQAQTLISRCAEHWPQLVTA
jgi:hypothetical protein